ncbi:MAG: zinc metalloprotease HtpX [Fervidicoccaceae archaeon]
MVMIFQALILEAIFAGLALALAIGLVSLLGGRLIGPEPRSLLGLRLSMIATAGAAFLGSLGVLLLAAQLLGAGPGILYGGVLFVALFMALQWLFAPAIINAAYRTRPPSLAEEWLVARLEPLARRAGLKRAPQLRIAEVDAPNAFAYGSPLFGNYVAVTRGLLELLPPEEVEAVLGHELGHLKHRDVAAILALSLLPAAMYYIGRSLLMWGWLVGSNSRKSGGNATLYYVGAGLLLVTAGFLFHFLVTHFSRLREYYADAFSGKLTGAPRLLQRALARLYVAYKEAPELSESANKTAAMLFIVNYLIWAYGAPAYDEFWGRRKSRRPRAYFGDIDRLVEELMRRREGGLSELFSTHPPISKRLRFLENLRVSLEARAL